MNPERQREIARKGGKAAHEKGTAHQFTSNEAREAGRKGGQVVSQHREHMVEIGRNGGRARRRKRSDSGMGAARPGSEQEMGENAPEDGESEGAAQGA
jgi:general stress protein YciG